MHTIEQTDLRHMIQAYSECALWASTDDAGAPLDRDYLVSEIAPETRDQMAEDCREFATDLPVGTMALWSAEQLGHDFWLTRNRHGAGFWDRGHGTLGQMLTARAHGHGSFDLYVGDDGQIHGA